MGDITCWAPRSSCLAHSVSTACTEFGRSVSHCQADGGTGKARRSGSLSRTQHSQVSHSCAQLFPAGCAHGHSSLHAPARQFQLYSAFLVKPRGAKQKLNLSVMCSPWPHLLLLPFPTAGAPWRWAEILTITVTKPQSSPWNYLPSKTHLLKQETLATRAAPQSQAWHS